MAIIILIGKNWPYSSAISVLAVMLHKELLHVYRGNKRWRSRRSEKTKENIHHLSSDKTQMCQIRCWAPFWGRMSLLDFISNISTSSWDLRHNHRGIVARHNGSKITDYGGALNIRCNSLSVITGIFLINFNDPSAPLGWWWVWRNVLKLMWDRMTGAAPWYSAWVFLIHICMLNNAPNYLGREAPVFCLVQILHITTILSLRFTVIGLVDRSSGWS